MSTQDTHENQDERSEANRDGSEKTTGPAKQVAETTAKTTETVPMLAHGTEQNARPGETRLESLRLLGIFVLGAACAAVLIRLVGGPPETAGEHPAAEETHQHTAGEIWTCSMHPQIRATEPGDCPICGMDLIPAASGDDDDLPAEHVRLSERARTLARIRTQPVDRHSGPTEDLRLLGRVDYDETRMRNVTAWTGGRIDRLVLRSTGDTVRRGQSVARLYSPEVYAASQDLIAATRQVQRLSGASEIARVASRAARDASRQRLLLLGMPASQLDRIASSGRPARQISIRSPFSGTVIERSATEGAYVQTGTVLYQIADLSKVWVQLDAYEQDLASIAQGQTVDLEIEGMEPMTGTVTFIDPTLDTRRRVTRVRVEVDNAEGRLRPGMFVQALVRGAEEDTQRPLQIPVSAPLFTGRRSLVYVEVEGADRPTYEARVVRLGPRLGDHFPVVAGLNEGERVVIRGAFVLDADLQIRGGNSMMAHPDDTVEGLYDDLVQVSADLRTKLAVVVSAYLDMADALAADDPALAKQHAAEILAGVEEVSRQAQADGGDVPDAWSSLEHHLRAHASHSVDAESMEVLRGAFEPLSDQISALIRRFGNPTESEIRLAFCPMADGNNGAEWLQRGAEVNNAYFGDVMRSCGEIRATVNPGSYLTGVAPSAPASGGMAGGHSH